MEMAEDALALKLRRGTEHDRAALFDRLQATGERAYDHVLRRLLSTPAGWEVPAGTDGDTAPRCAPPHDDQAAHHLAEGLLRLVGADRVPALAVTGGTARGALQAAASGVGKLAAAVPELPVAIVASRAATDRLWTDLDDRHLTALLAEGYVSVPEGPEPPAPELADDGIQTGAESRRRIRELGLGRSALQEHEALADGLHGDDTDADRARSAAERILHQCLEALPEARGLFGLNLTLPMRFGPRPVEIDLLAPSLRLAVEVDGPHHLRDAQAYRRDRRKDLLLQQAGYVVARVLAEDVHGDLDKVLDTVLSCVATRKGHGAQEGSS